MLNLLAMISECHIVLNYALLVYFYLEFVSLLSLQEISHV
jgi:hypothetical protein